MAYNSSSLSIKEFIGTPPQSSPTGQETPSNGLLESVPNLRIEVSPEHKLLSPVNYQQANRAYLAAYKWFSYQIAPIRKGKYPKLTVIVGQSDCGGMDACFDPNNSVLLIKEWGPESAVWIYQATVVAATCQFIPTSEIAAESWKWNRRDQEVFNDYLTVSPTPPKEK